MLTMDNGQQVARFEDFGLICEVGHNHPMNAEIEEKTIEIPGRVGAWNFGSEIRRKPFSWPIGYIETDKMALQHKLNQFVDFLFNEFAQPRQIKIVFDYEPDKYYLVKCNGQLIPERLVNAGRFNLPMVADNPNKQFIALSDEVTWDSDIPIISDITWLYGLHDFEIKSPQTIEVHNDGNLIVRPKILISGSASSLTLTLNGESFSFGQLSQPIEIDAEKYLVIVNGIEKLNAMTGRIEKLYYLPGLNKIRVDGSGLNLTMSIKFRNQYK